jgi:F-type H+-transporting ATPase subunit delta
MSVANAYAKALFQAAVDGKADARKLDEIEQQLEAVVSAINSTPAARIALLGPVTTVREKVAVLGEIGKKVGAGELFGRFLQLMARKQRLPILHEVRDAFRAVRLHAEGGVVGSLVAADAVGGADVEGLAQAFGRKLGKRVAFRVSTDASLLAGMKVTVNGVTYDGTLRSQLQRLRDRLLAGYSAQ